jgi:hypothetical protein
MAEASHKIIGIICHGLPFDLSNQIYQEFDYRYKEALYSIENYKTYNRLKRDLRTVQSILALSIFHKRLVTNLDAAIKFRQTVMLSSSAQIVSIGKYNLDQSESRKIAGILMHYQALKLKFGIHNTLFEYTETRDLLKSIIKFKTSFGKGKNRQKGNSPEDYFAF